MDYNDKIPTIIAATKTPRNIPFTKENLSRVETMSKSVEGLGGNKRRIDDNVYGNNEIDKNYADIRVNLDNKKSQDRYDQDSIPSNINMGDVWNDIPKYRYY